MKKLLKRILQTFIRIEKIPFTENGIAKEFCSMYVFGKHIASNTYKALDEKDEQCEWLGIL
jgi:hypothetical protein